MDGFLLEGQERSGLIFAFRRIVYYLKLFFKLFARRGMLTDADSDANTRQWTSFTMSLRESAPIPTAFDFTRFLASSLTFMTHLNEVSVYFDDKRLVKLRKVSGMPQELGIPKGLKNRSPSGIMSVDGIQSTRT